MELVDFTGRLNHHDKYREMLKILEKKCEYIEYVLIDEEDTAFVEKFQRFVVSVKKTNTWWGTKSARKSSVYRLQSSKEIFRYLQTMETFCKYVRSDNGDIVEQTDFGMNDIAFLDEENVPLLYTTTHEGEILIREDMAI